MVDRLLSSSSLCLSVLADVIGGRTSSYFFQHIIITTSLGFTQHRLISSPLCVIICFLVSLFATFCTYINLFLHWARLTTTLIVEICLHYFFDFFTNRVLVSITVLQFLYSSPPSLESRLELDHYSGDMLLLPFMKLCLMSNLSDIVFYVILRSIEHAFSHVFTQEKKQRKPPWKRIKCL